MKKILLILAVFFGIGQAYAENKLVVGETTIPQGLTGTIDIELQNDVDFTAFTLKLTLPEGLSFVLNGKGKVSFDEGSRFDDHALSVSDVTDNSVIFACLSASSAPISGTSGTLISVYVQSDESLEIGTKLAANITEPTFTTPGEKEYNLSAVNIPITIGEPRIQFNENAASLPAFTAGEKGDVRMTRSINANKWSTIVLPFTLTKAKAQAAFGDDVQLAEFSGFFADYGDDDENVIPLSITMKFTTYTMGTGKNMKGGKPYLIKTSKDITSFVADQCSLVGEVTPVSVTDEERDIDGKFIGSFVKTTVPEDGLFISNEKFWYSTGKTNINGFRGWFDLGAVLGKETDFEVKMYIDIDGEETSVEGISVSVPEGAIYDLSGRKLNNVPQKGIYIVNGKKVMK